MSDDEADPELLELLRQRFGLGANSSTAPPSTGVLKDAEYICDNSVDVAISLSGTKAAADIVWELMQEKQYSTESWSENCPHPKTRDEDTVNFIFTMNLLNFSFWSELPTEERFTVEYNGEKYTGYWSLIAALQRALDEGKQPRQWHSSTTHSQFHKATLAEPYTHHRYVTGHPITTPSFWTSTTTCTDELLAHIFRSCTAEPIPLLTERISILREAGTVLEENFESRPWNLIQSADNSAARLVNTLVEYFPNFHDVTTFHGKKVRILKRAQILVADLWACFNGESYGKFTDIDVLTMFADYRIPQMLHSLGVLMYSPRLESMIKRHVLLEPGTVEEVELRGCCIWGVEMLRRQIVKMHPEGAAEKGLNAVLIDFFLYDTCKEREKEGKEAEMLPHHRTRSIFY